MLRRKYEVILTEFLFNWCILFMAVDFVGDRLNLIMMEKLYPWTMYRLLLIIGEIGRTKTKAARSCYRFELVDGLIMCILVYLG